VTVQAMLQYRRSLGTALGYFLELGGGVNSFTGRIHLRAASRELLNIAGYQREPAYSLGGGLALRLPHNLDLVGGARYCGTRTGNGAVWASGDDPAFFLWSVGLRTPRVTH
jgi:hypothetical protein